MWDNLLVSGIVALIVSIVVTLIIRSKNAAERKSLSYNEIANRYELWDQHAQGSAWLGNNYMTMERFNLLSVEEKLQILNDRFGPEN